ncbi:MAG: hypothetical protein LBP52_04480 [Burkholderiaceae bacterium]|jgi:hypothetical protein|nr:hypothetical protein [Burkholderiaceae bacterium]
MNADNQDLIARREQLRLRSAHLREQLVVRVQVLRPAARLADSVQNGVGWAKSHPQWLALAGAAVLLGTMAVRPRRVLALGLRAWSGWQMFRKIKPVAMALMGRR